MKFKTSALVLSIAAALTACGGGGGGSGDSGSNVFNGGGSSGSGGTSATQTANAVISLVDESGAAITTVPLTGARLKIVATTKTGTAADVPMAGALVNVTSSSTDLVTVPASGSALTDANGVAYVQVKVASTSTGGATQITATAKSGTLQGQGYVQLQYPASNGSGSGGTTSYTFNSATVNYTGGATSLPTFGSVGVTFKVDGTSGAPVSLSLSSPCATSGKSSLPATVNTAADGTATVTYKDVLGCGSGGNTKDTITATLPSGVSKTVDVTVTPPQISNIQFLSSSYPVIYLPSSGCAVDQSGAGTLSCSTASTLKFKVVDQKLNGIAGVNVRLDLTPSTGGSYLGLDTSGNKLTSVVKTSDATGQVEVLVSAGTVPQPVTVQATLVDTPAITTNSTALSIATGTATQRSTSLSITRANIDGFNYDNDRTTIQMLLADRTGNPVPDGTTVNFVTSGGQVVGSCSTKRDAQGISGCSVTLASQDPRPANGYVNVLAYAVGEKSFTDTSGNNVYAQGMAFEDLGDVFLDTNESTSWDSGEQFFSFSGSAGNQACPAFGSASPLGSTVTALSKGNTCNGTWGKAFVRANVGVVFSQTSGGPRWSDWSSNMPAANVDPGIASVSVPCGSVVNRAYRLRDTNTLRNNPFPEGSTVSGDGKNVAVRVVSGDKVLSTTSPTVHVFEFSGRTCSTKPSGDDAFGYLVVTTPRGQIFKVPVTIN